jgi:hypothetical protein
VAAINGLAKRVKRVAFGITNWTHWRVRVLLYAGRPAWSKLATITPAAPRTSEEPDKLDPPIPAWVARARARRP